MVCSSINYVFILLRYDEELTVIDEREKEAKSRGYRGKPVKKLATWK